MFYVRDVTSTGLNSQFLYPTPSQRNGKIAKRETNPVGGLTEYAFSDYNGGQEGRQYYGYSRYF